MQILPKRLFILMAIWSLITVSGCAAPKASDDDTGQDHSTDSATQKGADGTGQATDGTDPVGTDLVGTDPVGSDPVGTDPVGTDPVGTDPVGTDPVATDPVGTDTDTPEPVTTDPRDTNTGLEIDAPLDTAREGDTDFVSADPSNSGYDDAPSADGSSDADSDTDSDADGDMDETNAADTDAGEAKEDDGDSEEDPEREIVEADIVHVVDNVLYALSRYRGLVTIDISDPADMKILGRFQAYGVPFEMYIKDGVAMAMYSSFYSYEYEEDTGTWQSTANSRVIALDVTDPANIVELGNFELLGTMSDSRIVGDVLYTVSFQNGYCWGCDRVAKTAITSMDISDVTQIDVVDSLEYEEEGYSWRRSIAVNQDRIYVSGPGWAADDGAYHSTLEVVDISDPAGDLVEGASVELAGQIESRWQMNEYEGVLRIISQPGSTWNSGAQPVVETFEVVSSQEILPLGRMEMTLPRPENLMSVRFDGYRGYAVTFERTDPLFVIDLSNPAMPVQMGELEIPGWLYHMEPRGDRLFAIGFDDTSDEGGMAVSLFDVADPTSPIMLDRVNFGGGWVGMPEDQDRIHKAFKILEDKELIMMPFSGWSRNTEGYYRRFHSGIQLIDFTNDTLTLRAAAPHSGRARRAFIHNDVLFAMSDERVDAFSIYDRDNPQLLSSVTLSRSVYRSVRNGDHVVELVSDWWTGEARLDILPADDADGDSPVATVNLAPLRPDNAYEYYYWRSGFNYYNTSLYSHENNVYLMWREYTRYVTDDGYTNGENMLGVAVIDMTDPTHPQLAGHTLLPIYYYPGYNYYYYGGASLPSVGTNIVQLGDVFVVQDRSNEGIHVLDLSDPTNIQVTTMEGRTETNMSGLSNGNGVVFSSHSEAVADTEGRVRFYLDRLDVSDPANPVWLPEVNIPGTPVYFDQASGKLVTIDYIWMVTEAATYDECRQGRYYYSFDYFEDTQECVILNYKLAMLQVVDNHAVMIRERMIGDLVRLNNIIATDETLFLNIPYSAIWDVVTESYHFDLPRLLAWSLDEDAPLRLMGDWRVRSRYAYLKDAKGTVALVSGNSPPTAFVYDASVSATDPLYEELLTGYGYEMQLTEDMIISSNGMWGVQTITF